MYANTTELDRVYPFEARVERAYHRLQSDIAQARHEIELQRSDAWAVRVYRRYCALLDMRVRLNGLRRMSWLTPAQSQLAYDHLAARFFTFWNA